MTSPQSRFAVLVAASAMLASAATPAFAASDTEARRAAIAACKTAVASQLSAEVADVNLDRIQTRGRTIELRLEVRKDGARVGLAECTYSRRDEKTDVVVIEPATKTASN
ncbi:MAG: hypothetical protein NW200_13450 [Hyphomonadaceae bacterium]|nr:hypothetical protein [Hyphomonadaceae bacterium]